MSQPLRRKRALVTGGSRGIGAAIVKRLAREGADVALTFVSKPEGANQFADATTAFGGRALAIQADAADAEAVARAVDQAAKEFGGLDILVNNAGIALLGSIDEFSLIALPRYGHADEIAAMVAYLAGPEAGFVTGASLMIDGGFSAWFKTGTHIGLLTDLRDLFRLKIDAELLPMQIDRDSSKPTSLRSAVSFDTAFDMN
jgi:NAD(P)-dependent dehydrogenase (short-subunit alcohol dehydrogenase family)